MKFLGLALCLAACINAAAAVPGGVDGVAAREAGASGRLAGRSAGGVYFCNGHAFTDKCKWFPRGNCVNLAPFGMQEQVTSIAPDQGVRCTFYILPNCLLGQQMKYKVYRHPGVDNVGPEWNDKFWSFQCY